MGKNLNPDWTPRVALSLQPLSIPAKKAGWMEETRITCRERRSVYGRSGAIQGYHKGDEIASKFLRKSIYFFDLATKRR